MDLKQLVKDKIVELGDKAPEYFGKKESALKMLARTGNIPLAMIQKVLDDHLAAQPTQTAPVVGPQQILEQHETSLRQIVAYLNAKVIPFFETEKAKFEEKFAAAEKQLAWLLTPQSVSGTGNGSRNESRTIADVMASDAAGNPGSSLTRPSAQTITTYSEPVGGGQTRIAHPLDSGIAPTAEQVRASQDPIQNAAPGQPPARLAGPAVPVEGAEQFGPPGWTKPYPPRR